MRIAFTFIIPLLFSTLLYSQESYNPNNILNGNKENKINILFIMADQHRGDLIGARGAHWLETPNLDKLAHEGIIFTKAYSSIPSCFPARTAILTGMSPWESGQLGYKPIANYPFEMPRILTNSGYRTHAVGKNHFTPMRNKHGYQTLELEESWYTSRRGEHASTEAKKDIPFPDDEKSDYTLFFENQMPDKNLNESGLGYTDHRGGISFPHKEEVHATNWTADRAIDFLNLYNEDKPWLLKVSFVRPHPPFDPPKRWLNHYKDTKIPEPNIGNWSKEKYGSETGSLEETPTAYFGNFPQEEIESSRRSYYAAISHVDEQIGRVIKALEERGELENTLILYTSDHGDMMGDHHLWRKCRALEGAANIPMIIRWPENMGVKKERGLVSDKLVELRDVMPTFLDAADIKHPIKVDGKSMFRVISGKSWRKILDLEHAQIYEDENAWTALTDGNYKYIYHTLTGKQQLFNLKNDPSEMNDLCSDKFNENHKNLIQKWRKKMIQHLKIRGEHWVKNGDLVIQEESIYYGENHPMYQNN